MSFSKLETIFDILAVSPKRNSLLPRERKRAKARDSLRAFDANCSIRATTFSGMNTNYHLERSSGCALIKIHEKSISRLIMTCAERFFRIALPAQMRAIVRTRE